MGNVLPFVGQAPRAACPAEVRRAIEFALERTMDATDRLLALLDRLDRLDGDPDLEPGGDDEPSLGAPVGGECQVPWSAGGTTDLELALGRLGRACGADPPRWTLPAETDPNPEPSQ